MTVTEAKPKICIALTVYEVVPGKLTWMSPPHCDADIIYSVFLIEKPKLHCLSHRAGDSI